MSEWVSDKYCQWSDLGPIKMINKRYDDYIIFDWSPCFCFVCLGRFHRRSEDMSHPFSLLVLDASHSLTCTGFWNVYWLEKERKWSNGVSPRLSISYMQSTDLLLWIKSRARRSVLCQLTGVLECGVIFAHSWLLVTFHSALFCSFHKFCAVSFLIVVRCPSVFSNGQGDQTD